MTGAGLVAGALATSGAALALPSLPIPEKLILNEEIENVWWYRWRAPRRRCAVAGAGAAEKGRNGLRPSSDE